MIYKKIKATSHMEIYGANPNEYTYKINPHLRLKENWGKRRQKDFKSYRIMEFAVRDCVF